MNEEQSRAIVACTRALTLAEPLGATIMRAVRGGVWGLALAYFAHQLYEFHWAFLHQSTAPAQCAIGIYTAVWLVGVYCTVRAASAILTSGIEAVNNRAKTRAAVLQ